MLAKTGHEQSKLPALFPKVHFLTDSHGIVQVMQRCMDVESFGLEIFSNQAFENQFYHAKR